MTISPLRFRQVHLDFHTSEHIPGIGDRFDPERFAATLERAHVDSITVFARCHHGYIYYDTERFPERRHPHLRRNLLKEQIEACHARGIRAPIYVTVQWDQFTANAHPEWLALEADGRVRGTPPYEAGFYRTLLVNSPYRDFLKAHVEEIFALLPVDGLFFDIVQVIDDSSVWTRNAMLAQGLNPADPAARLAFGKAVIDEFQADMSAFVRGFKEDCTIFYNSGHIGPRHRTGRESFSHFEVESLPTGHWGYEHFSLSARYARTLGVPVLGMTGKFHTAWGDFQSYKNQAALEFECFRMLALNATCSVGDQLDPDGAIDETTYALIGSVYESVAAKEPWCAGAQPLVEVAVLTPEEFNDERIPTETSGASKILSELGHQFDFIDSQADLSGYRVVILPDSIPLSDVLAAKLRAYVETGGALLCSHRSASHAGFARDVLGVEVVGDAPYSPDFILPGEALVSGLPQTEHVLYLRGLELRALDEAAVLAETHIPYFNRTWAHFCSHRHTPSSGEVGYPAVVRKGNVITFAHPIFTQYDAVAPRWCKQLVANALDLLLPDPLLRHDGPSTLMATVNAQPGRRVVHLLHYIPTRRGRELDIIEDVIPLHDVQLQLRADGPVSGVLLVPQNSPLPFTVNDGVVSFTVPVVRGHQMVAVAE
jgi:hypothetical protein